MRLATQLHHRSLKHVRSALHLAEETLFLTRRGTSADARQQPGKESKSKDDLQPKLNIEWLTGAQAGIICCEIGTTDGPKTRVAESAICAPKFKVLKTLNSSARNCNLTRSVMGVLLITAKSRVLNGGL